MKKQFVQRMFDSYSFFWNKHIFWDMFDKLGKVFSCFKVIQKTDASFGGPLPIAATSFRWSTTKVWTKSNFPQRWLLKSNKPGKHSWRMQLHKKLLLGIEMYLEILAFGIWGCFGDVFGARKEQNWQNLFGGSGEIVRLGGVYPKILSTQYTVRSRTVDRWQTRQM